MAHKVYFGPVYYRRQSEAYITVALAGTRRESGVSVAEVGPAANWGVANTKVGNSGTLYVVDDKDRLIAHPDISLVLRETNMSKLAQVQAARRVIEDASGEQVHVAQDVQGREVLSAYAPVRPGLPGLPLPPLGWLVFVELPVVEVDAVVSSAAALQ